MKKLFLFGLIFLIMILILLNIDIFINDEEPISSSEVVEILKVEPKLPDHWEITDIKKVDDGFISPFIRIYFSNNARVDIARGGMDVLGKNGIRKYINDRLIITAYEKDNNYSYYKIVDDNISYIYEINNQQTDELEEYLKHFGEAMGWIFWIKEK